jgi:gas vesicle protein
LRVRVRAGTFPTPASGADTRRRLGETSRRLRDTAGEKFEDMKNTFREGAKQVQNAVNEGREEYRRSTQQQPGQPQPHESPSRPGM